MRGWGACGITTVVLVVSIAANTAKGTATYKGKAKTVTVTFTHAYLVKGPDIVTGETIRRVVFSTKDIAEALKACETMSCAASLREGMTVDFDSGPRLNYWFVANDQLIQYSATAAPTAAKLTADLTDRLAGTLTIDATAAGGPKVDLQFDAGLVKELKK